MSYILDALKKSDQERKQGGVPNLQTVHIPMAVESQTPWVLYAFISLLLLALAFVIGFVILNKSPVVSENIFGDSRLSEKQAAAQAPANSQQPEITVIKPREDVYQNLNTVTIGAIPEPVEVPVKKPVKRRIEPVVKSLDLSNVPYLHELPDYQQQSVPEMTFAGHVYSTHSASRSIIINNVAMSEGDTVVQGINVIEITPSGVVFSLHDEFFRMDILQDWSF